MPFSTWAVELIVCAVSNILSYCHVEGKRSLDLIAEPLVVDVLVDAPLNYFIDDVVDVVAQGDKVGLIEAANHLWRGQHIFRP